MGVNENKLEPEIDKCKLISLDKLVKASWNYKDEDADMTKKLKANLLRNNQIEVLLVRLLDDDKYEIVNGNHRFDAMQDIGYKKALCYDLGDVSDNEAKRIAIETNETKFGINHQYLSNVMKSLDTEFTMDELVESMPFTTEEIENYIQMHDFDWDDYNSKLEDDNSTVGEEVEAKKANVLHFELSEDALAMWLECKAIAKDDSDYNCFVMLLKSVLGR